MLLRMLPAAAGLAVLLAAPPAGAKDAPLPTAPKVDLERYLGNWYEIARLPARFEKDCVGVTASYSKRDDGQIKVVNTCRVKTLDGKVKESTGRAKVVDPETNAKLEVTFFWPFWGDYWILEVGPDYEYAVVGEKSRDYFWILARTPRLDEALLTRLLDRAKELGFDTSKIIRVEQRADAPAFAAPPAAP